MTLTPKVPIVIYAESTPNPEAMKFVANKWIVPTGASFEYKSAAEALDSTLATDLFLFPFVKQVFISGNYTTITKNASVQWNEVIHHVREFLKLFIEEGKPAVNQQLTNGVPSDHSIPSTEVETKIVEVLEEYIRPAVEQDGGMIAFKSFDKGIVTVQMKGSCSGCPSSTMTLKAGIEALLKRMVPGVNEVVAEAV